MFKLAICCVFDPLARMADREEILHTEFDNEDQACLRALLWLEYRPNDIIMLVEAEQGLCKNCNQPVEEKPGWVRHRWIHSHTGAYACRSTGGRTQAEPYPTCVHCDEPIVLTERFGDRLWVHVKNDTHQHKFSHVNAEPKEA